ncbi:MAG TPA: class I SAM-dependent methyltransferase [Ktedonobacterales bacterium]|nr:class I SAM-dependent methyltransferase [Ktedonobacterales bacterium]
MTARDPRFAQAVELTTATYDVAARDYADRNERMGPTWVERMEQFLALLAEAEERRPIPELGRPGDDIELDEYLNFIPLLDAGCGTGRDARAFAAAGQIVLGVDLSQGMLDEAGERTARRLPTGAIRYALMDLRRLELPDASCRGVWCSASLLHLPLHAAPRAMAELARVARPGAPVALFVKSRQPDEEAERFEPYPTDAAPNGRRFYAYYTADEARALVTGAGLEIVSADVSTDLDHTRQHHWVSILARKL